MTPETEKRIEEIRENHLNGVYNAIDIPFLLSIIDELRAENERLRNHPAIIAFPEE